MNKLVRVLFSVFMIACIPNQAAGAPAVPPACTAGQLWQTRKALFEMVSFETMRYVRIHLGLYKKWTGPADSNLIERCEEVQAVLSGAGEGAVLFTGLDSDFYRNIASYSNSWVSHVGVAMREGGNWVVYESRAPNGLTHPTPLCSFLRRSANYQVAIARTRTPLTAAQVETLRSGLRSRLHRTYDYSFDFSNAQTQYCSKYVAQAYQDIGLEFGAPESLLDFYNHYQAIDSEKQSMGCFFEAWFGMLKFIGRYQGNGVPWSEPTLAPATQYNLAIAGKSDASLPFELIYESD